uniref:Uncharacterized protein n=1 Tax=uncultured bacterium pUR16A2 TaxID=1204710 RepID=R9QZM3_9BACT|nr:hypothetical protein [uncultured bacterium pUR16A2]
MNLKSLAKDTVIYGLSSIVGRFLNYLLVPVHTYRIPVESGGYGIVSNLYAYTAFFLALLTFGMETTLFRFCNKQEEDERMVYSTVLRIVGFVNLLFIVLVMVFLRPISEAMGYSTHPEYIACMAFVVAFDAFQAIMFSRLRQQHRPVKFMALKFAFIIPYVLLNLFLFYVMPNIPALVGIFNRFDYGVGLIFFVNLICTTCVFAGFTKELSEIGFGFDRGLARRLLRYTWPLLIFSLMGILNNVADKMLFPHLMPGTEGKVQLGIYGACVKIAMIMSLLVQAFRYAYEPIVFNGSNRKDNPETLALGMKYFIIFTLLAYMAVIFYMPLLQHFVPASYREGLDIVPIVMMAEIFMGVYFNLSFWYKLTDKTYWGAIMSAVGAAVMIAINIIFVPRMGYWACAWGGFAGYGVAMLMSFLIGRKKMPVKYDTRSILSFTGLALGMLVISMYCFKGLPVWAKMCLDSLMLLSYLYFIWIETKKSHV